VRSNLILIVLVILFSCKQEKSNSELGTISSKELVHINLSEFKKLAKVDSSIIKNIEFYELETNDNSLFGETSKVLTTDDNIIILDSRNTNSIFIFDYKGKFISKIANEGNGPGEYNFLGDMDIDSQDNLHLLDLRKNKVLEYKLDGKFKEDNKFDFLTYKFGVLGEDSYVFDQGTRNNVPISGINLDYKLITWIPSSQKLNKYLQFCEVYDSYSFPLPVPNNIYRSDDKLFYLKPYEYTVYQPISENEILEKYFIDFGKYQVPKSFYSNYSNDNFDIMKFISDLRKKDYAHTISNIYETSKHFCFNFSAGNKLHWVSMSKLNNHISIRAISSSIENYSFVLTPQAVVGDQFITILGSLSIEYLIKKWGKEQMEKAGLSILTEHNPNMNPVLIKWSLKDSF